MSHAFTKEGPPGWNCGHCGAPLQPVSVNIDYMGSSFYVQLPGCPNCGTAMIDAELAQGRMLEVEKLLEDK
jgi:ribosomal protein S27AE